MTQEQENLEKESLHWFVVQVLSGQENKVIRSLTEQINIHGLEASFGQIIVPTEEFVEMRGGKKVKSKRKYFPGYVLVQMAMDDHSWHLVKRTYGVRGFVGGTSEKPAPISQKDVDRILLSMEEGAEKPKPKTLFEVGEVVRVKDGPFVDFNGVVEDVNYDKNRLRVAVLIFGRSTPVDLEFSQVEKA